MRTLAIISHTEHYRSQEGQIVGLSSTIAEINHLTEIFDHIYHLAMFHDDTPPSNTMPYTSDNITFIELPALGGREVKDKLKILLNVPKVINRVAQTINKADYFQFRAPTGIGVFVIPFLILARSKEGWFKYAGNWKQRQAPLAYRFQRWLLKNQKRKVTINGQWENQPNHCLSFENPCLTDEELQIGQQIVIKKELLNNKFNLCFVGRLEEAKGIGMLLDALQELDTKYSDRIIQLHVIGEGRERTTYENMARKNNVKIRFYGLISRTEVHDIYKKCHAIILPSASEGFPKVIAEAMNYGCVPVVSNVSSISQYVINERNGFLFDPITSDVLKVTLLKLLRLNNEAYKALISGDDYKMTKFSFAYYNDRIITEIIQSVGS